MFSSVFNKFSNGSDVKKHLKAVNQNAQDYQGFFKDVNKMKDMGIDNSHILEIADQWNIADDSVLKYASSAKDAVSMDGFTDSIKKSELSVNSLGTTLASAGKSLLSFGINMAASMAIGFAIDAAIKGIYELVNANKIAIEEGQEAAENINTSYSNYDSQLQQVLSLSSKYSTQSKDRTATVNAERESIKDLGSEYERLSQGVDKNSNSNINLTDEDYQSYIDISNQLANLFPQLQVNTDGAGNAILNLGNNGSKAASQLQELIDAQRRLANFEIGEQLDKSYKGYLAQESDINDKLEAGTSKVESLTKAQRDLETIGVGRLDDNYTSLSDQLIGQRKNYGKSTVNVLKEHAQKIQKELRDQGIITNIEKQSTVDIDGKAYQRLEIIPELDESGMKTFVDTLGRYVNKEDNSIASDKQKAQQEVDALNLQLKEAWDGQITGIQDFLKTSASFTKVNSNLQNGILNNLDTIDKSVIQSDKYGGDIQSFLYGEYIEPISKISPRAQKALGELYAIDPKTISNTEFKSRQKKAISAAFPNDLDMQKEWNKRLGFDTMFQEADKQEQRLIEKLGHRREISKLSGEDREILFRLAIEDSDFNGTYEEAMQKKKQLENAVTIDLKPTDKLDAATAAAESENSGDRYLKMKDLAAKNEEQRKLGLTGTDDFKKGVAIFSPNDREDVGNWLENLPKVQRYFTDDKSGVDNFFSDLSNKVNASGEAMTVFDSQTGKWKTNIDDLGGAANQLGIGYESFMAIMGRAEDYGQVTNFVSSVEDGATKLTGLYTQLGEESQLLSELRAKQAAGDQTVTDAVISDQEARVNQIRQSIEETGQALNNIIAKSLESRNKDIESAKTAMQALADARQELLNDPTKYGDNTDAIRQGIEQDIQGYADKYNIKIDTDFNVVETPQDAVNGMTSGKPVLITVDMDTSSLSGDELNNYITKAQELNSAISNLNNLNVQKALGFTVEDSELQNARSTVTNLATEVAELNGNQISISAYVADESDVENLKDTLEQLPPDVQASVTCSVSGDADIADVQKVVREIKESGGADVTVNYLTGNVEQPSPGDLSADGKTNWYIGRFEKPNSSQLTAIGKVNWGVGSVVRPNLPTLTQNVQVNYLNKNMPTIRANGTAHARGTAPSLKTSRFNDGIFSAKASGDWGLKRDEKALVGELGTEAMVRDGRVYILGQGGAEFRSLKKGDIIFNHLQTRDLLRKGYVTGRGNLIGGTNGYANGTTHIDGLPAHASGSSDKFEETVDNIETALKRIKHAFDEFSKYAEDYYSGYHNQNRELGNAVNKAHELISANENAYVQYMQKANSVGLSQDWQNKVKNGQISINNITDENLSEKIKNYQEWYDKAVEVRDAIIDLNIQIRKLNIQKFDNVEDSFDAFVATAEQIYDGFNALNELLEAQGKNKSYTNTLEMLGQKGSAANALRGEVEQLRKLENEMLSNGSLVKWSKEYYELETRIIGVQQKLYETQAEEYKLREELRKIQWQPFEDALEKIDSVNDELSDTLDLIQDLNAFNSESGLMNSNGIAQLGLLAQLLGNSRQAVEDYNAAFEALNVELKNGNISQEQYNSELTDLKSKQRDAISDVKKYRDAIVDLVKDGIDKETAAMQKLIDKRKEDLRAQKENLDYARTMRDKTSAINKIQAQITALEGSTEDSDKAKLRDLKNQLKEAEQDLSDTQEDHKYDELSKGYDDAMDKFQEVQDKEKELLETSLEEQTKAIQNMLSAAKESYSEVYGELQKLAETYGFELSSDLVDPWKNAEEAVKQYQAAVGTVKPNASPGTNSVPGISTGQNNVQYAESVPSKPDNNVQNKVPATPPTSGMVSNISGMLRSGSRGDSVKALQTALNNLGYNVGNVDGIFGSKTLAGLKNFQRATGVSADGILGPNTKAQFRARGYVNGTPLIPYTGFALTDEKSAGSEIVSSQGVWRQVQHGDTVFNDRQVGFMYDFSKDPKAMLRDIVGDGANGATVQNVNTLTFHYDELVHIDNIEGNFDRSLIPQMQKVVDSSLGKWEKTMQNNFQKLGGRR